MQGFFLKKKLETLSTDRPHSRHFTEKSQLGELLIDK